MHIVCVQKDGSTTQPIHIKVELGVAEVYEQHKFTVSDEEKFLPVELALNKTLRMATDVQKKMDSLNKSETEQGMKSISTMIILLGVLSVGMVVGSALLQVYYLKQFFKRRKIL
eukprot:TRINITY_DN15430_c0_g5_i2.p4 TRINITY_DN15430_c0_g5~~TRINITY_DN15430_c0_g5_i2.p4  ORF type:complete len:114 (-),score=45.07 TRINITY_DN15430_c0_g5_i2:197-538(-)